MRPLPITLTKQPFKMQFCFGQAAHVAASIHKGNNAVTKLK